MKDSIRTLGGGERSTGGFTLIEVLIATTVLAVILGTVGLVISSGQRAYSEDVSSAHIDAMARRTIDLVSDELVDADRSTVVVTPAAPFVADQVDYERGQGWDAVGEQLTTTTARRMWLAYMPGEIDDGLDNNGNGLVDECRLLFSQDTNAVPMQVISRVNFVRELLEGELPNGIDDNGNGAIDEGGFYVDYDSTTGMFRAWVTIERTGNEGRTITRTVSTAVRVRND